MTQSRRFDPRHGKNWGLKRETLDLTLDRDLSDAL